MKAGIAAAMSMIASSWSNPLPSSYEGPRGPLTERMDGPSPRSSLIGGGGDGGGGGGPQQIALAAFIYPDNRETWDRLIGYPHEKLSVLVVNVLNGPDALFNPSWGRVIKDAAGSNRTVLGYVRTGYLGLATPTESFDWRTRLGSRELADWIAQIEADIDAWYYLYGDDIGGIFFDEAWNLCGVSDNASNQVAEVYAYMDRYVKTKHPGAFTVLNPGSPVPRCFEHTMDTLVTFEGPSDAPERPVDYKSKFVNIDWVPQDVRKIWHIVYEVAQSDIERAAELALERNAGLLHLTDDVGANGQNPYDVLPRDAYMRQLLAAVDGAVPLRETKSFPPGPAAGTVKSLSVTAFDYTSAHLSWTAAPDALGYQVYAGGTVRTSVPPGTTEITIGGLVPGETYDFSVAAIGGNGEESPHSPVASITSLALPNGKPVVNYTSSPSADTTTVRADVVVPYASARVYFWDTANCDLLRTESAYPVFRDGAQAPWACGRYMVEGGRLFRFAGAPPYPNDAVTWSWEEVAPVSQAREGTTYTWEVPVGTRTFDTSKVAVQVEGYGPRDAVFNPLI